MLSAGICEEEEEYDDDEFNNEYHDDKDDFGLDALLWNRTSRHRVARACPA